MEAEKKTFKKLTFADAMGLACPHSWPASLCPALFGIFWCLGRGISLTPLQGLLLTAACILLQSAVNTLNDYADYVAGTDSQSDFLEESDAVLVYRNINPGNALALGLGFLAAGAALGGIASAGSGPMPFVIGAVGALTVIGYSAGPAPVSGLPLGELVSGFVMGGLIPLGIAAAGDGYLHMEMIPECLPLILGIALIMLSNNGSDIEKDLRAGRRTLPVFLGRKRTWYLYKTMLALWIALLFLQPFLVLGPVGVACILPAFLIGRKAFGFLIRAGLNPQDRIRQMKSITAANLTGNGFLAAAYAAGFLTCVLSGGV